MTPAEVFERRDELLILDVRENDEWNAGRIEGALHIPMTQVDGRADEIELRLTPLERQPQRVVARHHHQQAGRTLALAVRRQVAEGSLVPGHFVSKARPVPKC